MTTITARQVNYKIRRILSSENAALFLKCQSIIGTLNSETYKKDSKIYLMETLKLSEKQISLFLDIFNELNSFSYTNTERVNSTTTISSTRTILSRLTNGFSHLNIYKHVCFN
jgi:hypothetical protein